MAKPVIYVAHPVSGDVGANLANVTEWIKWLVLNDPKRIYIAPWVAEVTAFLGMTVDPSFYDRVLLDDEEVVRHCDGILTVGGNMSPGMKREWQAASCAGKLLYDLSAYRTPADLDCFGWMLGRRARKDL